MTNYNELICRSQRFQEQEKIISIVVGQQLQKNRTHFMHPIPSLFYSF